ncbi:uncharacterized protein LOC6568899 [Drosophila grimshawi]|uniref:uncharacterized protein LOC6568899 n=1 Tax=Drosophila grimshawi TaxID=7222 RepID=UPI000C86E51D|nr:uncharacterized protein LOC6568899 [Drosophila grimshawi]
MIYTDNCCCCIELKCGCIIIAIVDVIIRGADHFIVDRDSLLGYATILTSGLYLISCIVLLIGALLSIRFLLIPYMVVALIHIIILTWECAYVILVDSFYDFVLFDVLQAVFSLYFTLVVYSFYDTL